MTYLMAMDYDGVLWRLNKGHILRWERWGSERDCRPADAREYCVAASDVDYFADVYEVTADELCNNLLGEAR